MSESIQGDIPLKLTQIQHAMSKAPEDELEEDDVEDGTEGAKQSPAKIPGSPPGGIPKKRLYAAGEISSLMATPRLSEGMGLVTPRQIAARPCVPKFLVEQVMVKVIREAR